MPRTATSFGADLEVDAECFEHAAADLVFERIVAEQAEMAGAAAGRDAGQDGRATGRRRLRGPGVEVGGACGFEFGLAAEFEGQTAEPVGNDRTILVPLSSRSSRIN